MCFYVLLLRRNKRWIINCHIIIIILLLHVFANIQQWASINKMKINVAKTTEIVVKRPNLRLSVHLAPVANIEQVRAAKLLGVVLCDSLLFDEQVHAVLIKDLVRECT